MSEIWKYNMFVPFLIQLPSNCFILMFCYHFQDRYDRFTSRYVFVATVYLVRDFLLLKGCKNRYNINAICWTHTKITVILATLSLSNSFYRYFQSAVDMWPVHGTRAMTALCRCYDTICTLYTHSVSEHGVINEEQVPSSHPLPWNTHFLWNYRQSNSFFSVAQFWALYTLGAAHRNRTRKFWNM